MTLEYAGECGSCGVRVAAGDAAWWKTATRELTCRACLRPPDPFTPIDFGLEGTPGGSARREAERRGITRRSVRRTWKRGADGERRLSEYLHQFARQGHFRLLDDREVPRTRGNIDHIAIAATGVYVIDTKAYSGTVKLEARGFGPWRRERLLVKGRDQTSLTENMDWQVEAVVAALESQTPIVPVRPVLCFVGSEWEPFSKSFTVNGVLVTAHRPLRRRLMKPGPIPIARRAALERALGMRLPAAVPRAPTRVHQA